MPNQTIPPNDAIRAKWDNIGCIGIMFVLSLPFWVPISVYGIVQAVKAAHGCKP